MLKGVLCVSHVMEGQDTTRWKYFFDTLRIAETPATLTLEAVRTGIGWERSEKS